MWARRFYGTCSRASGLSQQQQLLLREEADPNFCMHILDPFKHIEEEAELASLRQRAEAGDTEEMYKLALAYRDGEYGIAKDLKQSFTWLSKAAELDHVASIGLCGYCYLRGMGVDKDVPTGLVMVGQAAALGSEHACCLLGHAYKLGKFGLPKDAAKATKWYKRMSSCCVTRNAADCAREEAAKWLAEHP